jgi:hypothetical protein
LGGGEPAIIGLDEETLARFELSYAFADGFDSDDGFVARDGWFVRVDVTADFLKYGWGDAGCYFCFSGMSGELLYEFEVAEAQADRFDFTENLMRPRCGEGFSFVEDQLVGRD